MSVHRLGIAGSVFVLWVVLLGVVALPALAVAPEAPEVTVESVTATTATLQGVISPKVATFPVEPGTYQFVYRPSTTKECQGAGEILAPASPNVYFGLEAESFFEPVAALTADTEYAVCLIAETTGGKAISAPVMFTTALPPEAPETSSPAKAITATTAVLEGTLNPHASVKAGWFFYYSPGATCPGFASGPEPEPEVVGQALKEHVDVTGLEPHTKYVFCMVATNAAGEQALSSNEVSFETLAAAPTVIGESVPSVTATGARLEGVVNPSNEASECHFQYGVASVAEHEVACEQPILEGGVPVGVGVSVAGLTQHTTYHYRIAAKNATGIGGGGEEEFTTGTPEPPETKAASEVTSSTAALNGVLNPKHAGEAGAYEFVYRKSASGCLGEGETPTPANVANGLSPEPVPPQEVTGLLPGNTYTYCLRALNGASEPALGNAVSFTTLAVPPVVSEEFVLNVSSGSATLNGQINPGGAETAYRFEYGTTSSYGKSVSGELMAGDETVSVSAHPQGLMSGVLYHYRLVAGNEVDGEVAGPDQTFTTQPAGSAFVLPDGRAWEMVSPPDKAGGEVSMRQVGIGGDSQASENGDAITYITSVPISANARSNPFEPQVISRRGPDGWISEDLTTPHNGASGEEYEKAKPGSLKPRLGELAEYMAFSPDLSLAYVQPEADTPLVAGQPPLERVEAHDPHSQAENYLGGYIRDMASGVFTTVSPLQPLEWYDEQVARVQAPPSCSAGSSPAKGVGVDAVSRDGCYVYFNSESVLAPGATGTDPLYVSHYDGGVWRTTFVASLSGTGAPEWSGLYVELSPNGRYVAFMSELSLTGYDNRDAATGELDTEVFLYDAATNHLACASCNPTGARPMGRFDIRFGSGFGIPPGGDTLVDPSNEWGNHRLAGILPEWTFEGSPEFGFNHIYQPRYVFDDGRLFFDSPDTLVSQDINGLENVYEYEPEGAESCTGVQTGGPGCLSLISSGTSDKESAFIDASASSADVFFITDSRLTPQDDDNFFDIYDAHVCSASIPCQAPLVSPPACETSDSCKTPSTPQPGIFGAPPSATFAGAGNASSQVSKQTARKRAVKCLKNKRLSHGKCVKKPKAKRKPAKGRK